MGFRRTYRTAGDIIPDVAARKRRAAEAGREPPVSTEVAREVYQAACDEIGAALAAHGFRYARSYPRARRSSGSWIDEISMGSSHSNVAGEFVSIDLVVSVWSRRFARWRAEQAAALSTWDRVAGTNLGYLLDDPGYSEWNLADPSTRPGVIKEITGAVMTAASAWLELFHDRVALVATLRTGSVTGLEPGDAVELLLWLGETDAARSHALAALEANPAMAALFHAEFERIARHGLAREYQYTSRGPALAYAVAAHGLNVP